MRETPVLRFVPLHEIPDHALLSRHNRVVVVLLVATVFVGSIASEVGFTGGLI